MSSNGGDNDVKQCDDSEEINSSKKEFTSCEQNNDVENITEGINKVAILDDMSTCAACGKECNSEDMNICNKCKMVKYCNAACKKKHRTKHKKACERRVAELHDEKLFADPPPPEECPICMLPLPINANQSTFESCCGKLICDGCIYAMKMSEGKNLCAFCRTPPPTSGEEQIKRAKKLMDKGNADAYNHLAGFYSTGQCGLTQDWTKANELYLKAGELGCAGAYYNLGQVYRLGRGVEVDKNKSKYYYELAAMAGHVGARNNLGCMEGMAGNNHRAYKHLLIAVRAGNERSLDIIKNMFMQGSITKDEYERTLHAYHERQELKSEMRDKAAAAAAAAARNQL